MSVNVADIIF